MRLHLGTPCAQQAPQHSKREPHDALRTNRRNAAKHRNKDQRNQNDAWPQPKALRQGNAEGKQPGRVKKRNDACAET